MADNPTSTRKKTSTRAKRSAARREVSDQARTVEWHGLDLTIPNEMPVITSLKLRRLVRTDRIDDAADVVESVIGRRQMLRVEDVLSDVQDTDKVASELGGLISQLLKEYGVTEGEVPASPSS